MSKDIWGEEKYMIRVSYTYSGEIEVEAGDQDEALLKAKDWIDLDDIFKGDPKVTAERI